MPTSEELVRKERNRLPHRLRPHRGKEAAARRQRTRKDHWKRASSLSPDKILGAFRNSYHPRIAVTVDMIATGTDITAPRVSAISKRGATSQSPAASRDNPLEIVFFMLSVASKNFFEQMKGRGVRVVSDTEMEQVNPGIKRKTRYLIVDAVGVCERVLTESRRWSPCPLSLWRRSSSMSPSAITSGNTLTSHGNRLALQGSVCWISPFQPTIPTDCCVAARAPATFAAKRFR